MQKDNFPKIPPLPHITGKELFEDDKKAEEWFHALTLRRAALANLIALTQASMYSKDGSPMRKSLSSCRRAQMAYTDIS